jgi:histidinol phosphatase-like PHP family hydrolase
MDKDRLPIIETEFIGPNKREPPSVLERRRERREQVDGLASFILQWWRGDAHTHSQESTRPGFNYTEGVYDLPEIAAYYKELGLEFVCLAEHASKPGEPEQQNPSSAVCQSLLVEASRIAQFNQENQGGIAVLSGVETNVLFDKSGKPVLDLPPEVLGQLDLVIASRHAIAREKEPAAIKETLLFAIRDPTVDIIGHPDRYTRRDGDQPAEYWQEYWGIWPEILAEMARYGRAFEINLNNPPDQRIIKMAVEAGVRFFINYDAHGFDQYRREKTELTKRGGEAMNRWAKGEFQEEDSEILREYKINRLTAGPGVIAILRLVRWIKTLDSLGVTPQQVMNSSLENLLEFLQDRGKETKNLRFLAGS